MKQYAIKSTNIAFIGYNEVEEILQIEFKLNIIHRYFEVPLDEFVALMKADNTEDFYFNFINCKYHYDAL